MFNIQRLGTAKDIGVSVNQEQQCHIGPLLLTLLNVWTLTKPGL